MHIPYTLALHGGAGTIAPGSLSEELPYHQGLLTALAAGRQVLERGGSALEAVVAAVVSLEDCPLFNAGHGAVFGADERHELDAGVMEGTHRAAGGVAGVRTIRNPVLGALEVLRDGRCVLMGGEGAERFAAARGLAPVDPSYFSTPLRRAQWIEVRERHGAVARLDHDTEDKLEPTHRFGTVGAVARDTYGHLAAATSTGGMTNKLSGRIGDSPVVGAGVFADDATCAVSCTGTGEHFLRACVGHDVHARMLYLGHDVLTAARDTVAHELSALGGRGGLVAVGADGQIAMPFNSRGMYRAWVREGESPRSAVFG